VAARRKLRRFRHSFAGNTLKPHGAPVGTGSAQGDAMTQPRYVVPGMTVMITRRTLLRTFLLRPDPKVRQIYLYCLAVLAARFGVQVHALILMSTHEHLMITDTRGELPLFLREFHRTVALCIKALRRWDGPVWDHERASIVRLVTPESVIQTASYMMANPVSAGLVPRGRDWPGVSVTPEQLGRKRWSVDRPDVYFDRANSLQWPDAATLELSMPDNMSMSEDAFRAAVSEQLAQAEASAAADVRARGLAFLGRNRVSRCSPFKRAKSLIAKKPLNPTFAVGKGQRDALVNSLAVLRAFRCAYRSALADWRHGAREVLFPIGTWLMRHLHGAYVVSAVLPAH
jgi:putative transposase